MNTSKLRGKRVILPSAAVVAVLGIGGVAWGATATADRERLGTAATERVGGGTAVEVETSDDPGEAYEVEVRTDDGSEVDVALDEDLDVVSEERDGDDADDLDDGDDDRDDDRDDMPVADDRTLDDSERTAESAALDAVGGGTVTEVQASGDADFEVLRKSRDQ